MKLPPRFFLLVTLVAGLPSVQRSAVAASPTAVETYVADSKHSSVGFTLRNLFTRVSGRFVRFNATLTLDREHWDQSSAEASVEVASIATGASERDAHLQQPEFFDATRFPAMTFKSTSWRKTGAETFDVTGNLTIKGVTKAIVLKVKLPSPGPSAPPTTALSDWEATTTINRHDFGVSAYPKIIGADVDITIHLEVILKR